MNFKKIMLITFLLLSVITIGAASASDDVDALAVDVTGDEAVVEAPVDEDVIETPADEEVIEAEETDDALQDSLSPKDFNVTFLVSEVDMSSGDTAVIRFYWPEGVGTHYDSVNVAVEGGSRPWFTNEGGKTFTDVTLDDLLIFEQGTYNITVDYNDAMVLAQGTLKVTKTYTANDFIELYSKTITDSNDYVCNVFDSYGGLNGEVTVLANGTQVYFNNFNGSPQSVRINGKDLTGDLNGQYTVKVIYKRATNGKEYYKQSTITFGNSEPVIPDNRTVIILEAKADSIEYGEDAVVKIQAIDDNGNVNKTFSGNVFVEVKYLKYGSFFTAASADVYLRNGIGSAKFSNLNASSYTIYLDANETEDYNVTLYLGTLKVNKAESKILFKDNFMDVDAGNPFNLTVNYEKASGITATVDGADVDVKGNVVSIPALDVGNHDLIIYTIPDDNHFDTYKIVTLTATKPKSHIYVDKEVSLYENSSVNVTVITEGAIGFTAVIQGHPDAISINGNIIIISNLNEGTYSLNITTLVDDDHLSVSEDVKVTVKVLESSIAFSDASITFDYGSSGFTEVTVGNGTVGEYNVLSHPEAVIALDGNKITVSNLSAGTYTLSVATVPDEGYRAVTGNLPVIVKKLNSVVKYTNDVVFDYGSSGSTNVTVINGTVVSVSVLNSKANISRNGSQITVSGLNVGSYYLAIVTDGANENFNGVVTNIPVTVNKIATAVSASKISVAYGASKNIVVTLKDSNGNALANKKVSVTFNNVVYSGTTGSDGKASIAITKTAVAPKTYASTLTFAGDGTYAKSTGTVNVVVTKATPKLTAKAKTFKKSVKTKKYTVTLKNNLNKVMKNTKVTLKVNKKTYTAKTNSKGVATFKITKLTKKGKYTATVKYAGSKYYNAKTAKPKITVK